jgi:hypothetical protein
MINIFNPFFFPRKEGKWALQNHHLLCSHTGVCNVLSCHINSKYKQHDLFSLPFPTVKKRMNTYIHTYIHNTYSNIYYTHTHKTLHTYIYNTYTHTHACIHTYIHTHIHTYVRTYIHTYVHIHTYIHTYIHNTHTQVYIAKCETLIFSYDVK